MYFTVEPTIDYQTIRDEFERKYGYRVNVLETCFGDWYTNDSSQTLCLDIDDDSEEDFIKIVNLVKEMLKEDGLDGYDYVIVNICW